MTSRHLGSYLLEAADAWRGRPACADASGTHTYDDYLRESLRIAALLGVCGVTAGDRVCISAPKSFALYSSIYGAILLNACYVPIDYTAPIERARRIIGDCAAAALITTRKNLKRILGDRLPAGWNDAGSNELIVARLNSAGDGDAPLREILPWSTLLDEASPRVEIDDQSSPAYILYTSGSTGEPKGVVHTHRSASTFVEWAVDELKITDGDVIPQVASVSFDLSVFDIFGAARAGACLVPVHESVMNSPVSFCRAVAKAKATVLYCVPSLVLRETGSHLLAWSELRQSSLRHLVLAGEPINKHALRRLRPYIPNVELHNWYGPTETNVCCFHRIIDSDLAEDDPIPIGAACPYDRLFFIWDSPDSHTGELLVAGETVMTGYWNRPEATSRATFLDDNGDKFYRTGDFVYYNKRQELIFVGRRDRQVKVQGRRVQLDEIESTLQKRLPNCEIACTLIRPDGAVDPIIAAGIVGDVKVAGDKLISPLDDYLPTFMIPEVFTLDALPRTERGKIDYVGLGRILSDKYLKAR